MCVLCVEEYMAMRIAFVVFVSFFAGELCQMYLLPWLHAH
jgi:hypothetical protein